MTALIEVRTYRAQPGKRDELMRLLAERAMPVLMMPLLDTYGAVVVEDSTGLWDQWPR